jgi:hypothetical protein
MPVEKKHKLAEVMTEVDEKVTEKENQKSLKRTKMIFSFEENLEGVLADTEVYLDYIHDDLNEYISERELPQQQVRAINIGLEVFTNALNQYLKAMAMLYQKISRLSSFVEVERAKQYKIIIDSIVNMSTTFKGQIITFNKTLWSILKDSDDNFGLDNMVDFGKRFCRVLINRLHQLDAAKFSIWAEGDGAKTFEKFEEFLHKFHEITPVISTAKPKKPLTVAKKILIRHTKPSRE